MHSFNLKNYPAQALISRLGLTGKKVLGRGSFSAVFAHPDVLRDTVLKITTDKAGYAYLEEGARCYNLNESSYFPKVIDYFEELNDELVESGSEFRVIEMERLSKGRVPQLERRLLYAYASRTFNDLTPYPVSDDEQDWVDRMERKHEKLCKRMEEFATRLATFCADYHFRIDGLGGGNSMLRGDQLVFNDPVFCKAAMDAVQTKYREARTPRHQFH